MSEPSVLIIGAGLAGLVAAQRLRQEGLSPVLVEARERAGGRLLTDTSLGFPVDLGAAWIHDDFIDHPILELARQLGLRHQRLEGRNLSAFRKSRQLVPTNEIDQMWRRVYQQLGEDQRHPASPLFTPEEFAELNPPSDSKAQKQILDWELAMLAFPFGAEVEELARGSLDNSEGQPADELLIDGYEPIVDHLSKDLDIRYGEVVTRVSNLQNRVEVETSKGVHEAERALLTLPLGVLKSDTIRFDPPLPDDKTSSIQRLGVGLTNKIVLKFPRVFWPEDRHLLGYLAEARGELPIFLNLHAFIDQPVLVARLSGDYARRAEEAGDGALRFRAMHALRAMFGAGIPEPEAVIVTRWGQDPFARGSISYLGVGSSRQDSALLAEPVDQRLFFAGEATVELNRGTTVGAYRSGIREAARILAALQND